jgi:hypothetical protein
VVREAAPAVDLGAVAVDGGADEVDAVEEIMAFSSHKNRAMVELYIVRNGGPAVRER